MTSIRYSFALLLVIVSIACNRPATPPDNAAKTAAPATPAPAVADHFSYPIGKNETVTQKKDGDEWYTMMDFGQEDSLGEIWSLNKINTGCGQPVYAAANGVVTYAKESDMEWGLVMIVEHQLPSGEKVESLYGNLFDVKVKEGQVKERQQIGSVGNANGRYFCRLYFEIRTSGSPFWGKPGPLTSKDRTGWVDPSDFIDSHR